MHRLDFLSKAPSVLIFGHDSNKTNLGGILTLLYIIIVLLLIVIYIYDYSVNNKYSVLYTYDNEYMDGSAIWNERQRNENYNPEIIYSIDVDYVNKYHFFILDINERENSGYHLLGSQIKSNAYYLSFALVYLCLKTENNDCAIREEDKQDWGDYRIAFQYRGFKIDHQSEDSPLKKVYIY